MAIALTHISLLVSNVQNSLNFYRDTLDLEVIQDLGNYAELKANENVKLSLFDRQAMAEAVPEVAASQTNGHRSVLEFHVDNLAEFCKTLQAKRVQFVQDITDHPDWGIRSAYVEDIDGNLIDLFEPLQ